MLRTSSQTHKEVFEGTSLFLTRSEIMV